MSDAERDTDEERQQWQEWEQDFSTFLLFRDSLRDDAALTALVNNTPVKKLFGYFIRTVSFDRAAPSVPAYFSHLWLEISPPLPDREQHGQKQDIGGMWFHPHPSVRDIDVRQLTIVSTAGLLVDSFNYFPAEHCGIWALTHSHATHKQKTCQCRHLPSRPARHADRQPCVLPCKACAQRLSTWQNRFYAALEMILAEEGEGKVGLSSTLTKRRLSHYKTKKKSSED